MTSEGPINVLVCAPLMGTDLSPVREFEPAVRVIDGNAAFNALHAAMRGGDADKLETARSEMASLLRQADILCMSHPMLKEVAVYAPRLRWMHHTQAGVSNLWTSDVWSREDLLLTSGRGHVRPTAMAEYVIAGALMFARGIWDGIQDKQAGQLDRSHYQAVRIQGATMGVVGLGGIGKEVARLSRALGMRVVATRRSVLEPQHNVDGADLLLPAAHIDRLAAESDFVAVCAQLTRETLRLINADVLAAMKQSAVLINVSRGEVIDEEPLIEALKAGRLRGAVLDVYDGELEGKPPRPELMQLPNIVLTPHVSTAGQDSDNGFMRLFCENLRRYLNNQPLLNVIDRERGY
jgi:D-2-hydroxyacid dehydrogenase (NADP+)